MTQEEKELLVKYLCAALPYGVVIKEEYGDYINVNLYNANLEHLIDRISEGLDKLVLRPMSSMTEEEIKELSELPTTINNIGVTFPNPPYYIEVVKVKHIRWLLENHFDFMGLIPKGLAIEVTENNNPYKE